MLKFNGQYTDNHLKNFGGTVVTDINIKPLSTTGRVKLEETVHIVLIKN